MVLIWDQKFKKTKRATSNGAIWDEFIEQH